MSRRIDDLVELMVAEAPTTFTDLSLKYIKECAETYARECSEATLIQASRSAKLDYEYSPAQDKFLPDGVDKESITNPNNIILL